MKIISIEKQKGSFRVHNIETEKNNNYFANGMLVHNCFAYFFKSNNPSVKDLSLRSVDVDRMISDMSGKATGGRGKLMYESFYKRKFLLHWGGLADPFCGFERSNKSGLKLIQWLGKNNYPCLFSFKGPTVLDPEYLHEWKKWRKQRNFAFQVSIITADDEVARKVEIGVPSPTKRFEAMKTLSDLGYYTILRLRPFIIGISDDTLPELLSKARDAGARGVSLEFFAMDSRANTGMKTRYDWLAKMIGCKDAAGLHDYFSTLSPSERGGYMRLNRLVKEPFIKTVWKFCAKHDMTVGISDPDFKELNTSGSCCAMPDHYPENPLLENWTRNQLTCHLKLARQQFHRNKGEKPVFIRFGEVYGNESYLDNQALAQDSVVVIGKNNAERALTTQRTILRDHWNNLRSYANPRNYLHGKIMPCKERDEDGNIVYAYVESEYEQRWKAEGIDLTR